MRDNYNYRYQPGYKIGGRYKVGRCLHGGFGEVYLCHDLAENVPIALKTFRSDKTDYRDMFRTELQNWIELGSHPNIVQCFRFELLENLPFALVEWVNNEYSEISLSNWAWSLYRGQVPLQKALDIGIDICRGLVYTQSKIQGMVHRDLKPDNILMGYGGVAKITDFGLLKSFGKVQLLIDSTPDEAMSGYYSSDQNISNKQINIAGTPAYMAPEQFQGRENLDVRTDIYAVGCILYKILTGKRPYEGTINGLKEQHINAPVPTLDEYDNLPDGLSELIQKCLDKDFEKRPFPENLLVDLSIIYRATFKTHTRELPEQDVKLWSHIQRSNSYFQLQLPDKALVEADKFINQADPKNKTHAFFLPLAYVCRADVYNELDRDEEAMADCNKAIALKSDFWLAYLQRSTFHILNGDVDKATEDFNVVVTEQLQHPFTYLVGALLKLTDQLDPLAALEEIERAIDLNPDFERAYMVRAGIYNLLGRHKEALADLDRSVRIAPYINKKTAKSIFVQRGIAYVELRQLPEAEKELSEAIKIDPDEPEAYVGRGTFYRESLQYYKALADFDKAIKLNEDLVQAYIEQGHTYIILRVFDQAEKDINKAIKLAPNNPLSYVYRGLLYKELGYFEEALQDFDEVIKLVPAMSLVYVERGWVYILQQKFEQALEDINYAIELLPDIAYFYLARSVVYSFQSEIDRALEDLDIALRIEPDFIFGYLARAEIHANLYNLEQAAEDLDYVTKQIDEKGLILPPLEDISFKLLSSQMALQWGELEKVTNYFQDIEKVLPTLNALHRLMYYRLQSVLHNQLGERVKAKEYLNEVIALSENEYIPHVFLGQIYFMRGSLAFNLGDFEAALPDIDTALALNPNNLVARNMRGAVNQLIEVEKSGDVDLTELKTHLPDTMTTFQSGMTQFLNEIPTSAEDYVARASFFMASQLYPVALSELEKAIQLDPNYAPAYLQRAMIWVQVQAFPNVIIDATYYIQLEPDDGQGYTIRGVAYQSLQQIEEAYRDLEKAIQLDPEQYMAHLSLGELYIAVGQPQKALYHLQQIDEPKEMLLPQQITMYHALYGATHLSLNQYPEAIVEFNIAIDDIANLPPQYAGLVYGQRALCFVISEQFDQAEIDIQAALQLNPQLPQAHFAKGLLLFRQEKLQEAIPHLELAEQFGMLPARTFIEQAKAGIAGAPPFDDKMIEMVMEKLIEVDSLESARELVDEYPAVLNKGMLHMLKNWVMGEAIAHEISSDDAERQLAEQIFDWFDEVFAEQDEANKVALPTPTQSDHSAEVPSNDVEAALEVFIETETLDELTQAIKQYPILADDEIMMVLEQVIGPNLPIEFRAKFNQKMDWLKQLI